MGFRIAHYEKIDRPFEVAKALALNTLAKSLIEWDVNFEVSKDILFEKYILDKDITKDYNNISKNIKLKEDDEKVCNDLLKTLFLLTSEYDNTIVLQMEENTKSEIAKIENNDCLVIYYNQPETFTHYNEDTGDFYIKQEDIDLDFVRPATGKQIPTEFYNYEDMYSWYTNKENIEKYNIPEITEEKRKNLEIFWKKYPESMVCYE